MFEKKVVFSASLLDFHVDEVLFQKSIYCLRVSAGTPLTLPALPPPPALSTRPLLIFFSFLPYNCDCHNHHQQSSSRLLPASSCLSSAGRDAQMMTLSMTPLEREWHQSAKTTEMQFRVEKKQPLSTWGEYHVFD